MPKYFINKLTLERSHILNINISLYAHYVILTFIRSRGLINHSKESERDFFESFGFLITFLLIFSYDFFLDSFDFSDKVYVIFSNDLPLVYDNVMELKSPVTGI